MSYFRLASVVILLLASCDKSSDSKKKEKESDDEDGVSVGKYCEKMVKLSDEAAEANLKAIGGKKKKDPDEPDHDTQVSFCKGMFSNAKSEEPKAYACMADCMMSAKTREDEQTCVEEKKCLAKAKNKKLFSNRVD